MVLTPWLDALGRPLLDATGKPFLCEACPCPTTPKAFCVCGHEADSEDIVPGQLTITISGFSSSENWGCGTKSCNLFDGTYVFDLSDRCNRQIATGLFSETHGPNSCQPFGGTITYNWGVIAGWGVTGQNPVPPDANALTCILFTRHFSSPGVPVDYSVGWQSPTAPAKPGGHCWRNGSSGTMTRYATFGTATCTSPATVSYVFERL